jgi:predicted ATP-grasp superfamily ATP-dependent carboligase
LKADECVPIYENRVYSCRKWVCANRNELDLAVNEWQERVPLLAQAFITGVGEGVFGLAAIDDVRAWSGHHRVRMMNPQGSGSSACESQPVTETIKENTRRMMSNTVWRGLFMIELLRDERGNEWFVELNGRPWGSMALCRRQGFEYPAWHVALEMNPNAPVGTDAPKGFSMVCRNAGREFMHVLFVLKGAKSKALNRWPSFWKTLWDVLHFRKNDGLYNWHPDDMKVFLADFYYTIHGNIFKSKH